VGGLGHMEKRSCRGANLCRTWVSYPGGDGGGCYRICQLLGSRSRASETIRWEEGDSERVSGEIGR
jgi:hypothetical protein